MKIINLAILFTLIFSPLFWIQYQQLEYQYKAQTQEHMYNLYLDTAVKDATTVLGMAKLKDTDRHVSDKQFDLDIDEAVETFEKSLTMNFGVDGNETARHYVMSYVPAVVIVDYDGFYIYAMDEYTDTRGHKVLGHVLRAKQPYAYADQSGNSISFTLDDYVHVYVKSTGQWMEGTFNELYGRTPVSILNDRTRFEEIRRQTIINSIQRSLEYHINRHTQMVYSYGVKYTFTLPYIEDEEWTNTIADVGMIAFMQGIPLGNRHYNNYALGGARLLKKSPIIGTEAPDGSKFYFDSRCSIPSNYTQVEVFQSKKDAASKGYKPVDCLNPFVI